MWHNNARSQYTKGHSTLESSQNGLLSYLPVFVQRCVYTVLHLNSHDARSLSAECESSIPGKCALVTGIMHSLTLSISLGECLVNFSGAFAKLRKVTISFVMSVRLPYVRPHGITRLPMDGFSWNLIFEEFFKIVEDIQVLIKSETNKEYFTQRPIYLF
jgi:hypothetical protein